MNRIILIGNGFDLAHGLKTSYADFIDWYWDKRVYELRDIYSNESSDALCSMEILKEPDQQWQSFYWNNLERIQSVPGKEIIKMISDDYDRFRVSKSTFFASIIDRITVKGWVDIESLYYRLLYPVNEDILFYERYDRPEMLNDELAYIRNLLIEYLKNVQEKHINDAIANQNIKEKLYAPINPKDISIGAMAELNRFVNERFDYDSDISWSNVSDWDELLEDFDVKDRNQSKLEIKNFVKSYQKQVEYIGIESIVKNEFPEYFLLPNGIMLLNFNYTNTADFYLRKNERFVVNHIHGNLNEPEGVIFGYGDELDENYKKMSEENDNEYLRNIKSVKYLESPNYRNLLEFIESSPYQIFIMGHSCGNSDRTLLNTLFEHKNCVSIKPFYHKWEDGTDNYLELAQNISRNFTDMKLMRDRVVNKTFCETI